MRRAGRVRLLVVGLGVALAWLTIAPRFGSGVAFAQSQGSGTPTVFSRDRSFRIPFKINPEDQERIAEVHLYVSADRGLSWDGAGSTTPDQVAFPFRADRDGEFWFAVRTRDARGRLYPPGNVAVSPSLKVIVDTVAPALVVDPMPRRGSRAAIRWEVRDENLDLSTLNIEYQAQGTPGGSWRQVQFNRSMAGEAQWDALTAGALNVRVSVEDKAGNRRQIERVLPDGIAQTTPIANQSPEGGAAPAPIAQVPYQSPLQQRRAASDGGFGDPFENADSEPMLPTPSQGAGPRNSTQSPNPTPSPGPPPSAEGPPPPRPGPDPPPGDGSILVGSPRFPLQYEVLDADWNSVAVVELWITRDGGQSWKMHATDPDRRSPFPVDLGGDGVFGLRLVVKSASGLGDPEPKPGDEADVIVVVDTTPPRVQLEPPRIGTDSDAGKLIIRWSADDPHLHDRPVVLSYRLDQPGAIWHQITEPLANTGSYAWPLPPGMPARFHIRIDVFDAVENQGSDETSQPIELDLARPRGRILGLDPSARVGVGRSR